MCIVPCVSPTTSCCYMTSLISLCIVPCVSPTTSCCYMTALDLDLEPDWQTTLILSFKDTEDTDPVSLQINDILTPTLCSLMQYSHSILETIMKKDHKILKMNLEVFLEQVGETLCVYNDSYYKHTVVLNIVVILMLIDWNLALKCWGICGFEKIGRDDLIVTAFAEPGTVISNCKIILIVKKVKEGPWIWHLWTSSNVSQFNLFYFNCNNPPSHHYSKIFGNLIFLSWGLGFTHNNLH